MKCIGEFYELISTPLYIAIGMGGMKVLDWLRFRKKDKKIEAGKQLDNERTVFENLENINKNLSRQIDENVEKFLELTQKMQDLLNINIEIRTENSALKEEIKKLNLEVETLRKMLKQTEDEVECLKKYIKLNIEKK